MLACMALFDPLKCFQIVLKDGVAKVCKEDSSQSSRQRPNRSDMATDPARGFTLESQAELGARIRD